ncbi:MAG: endonuclease III [Ferrimicrobium sp.]
MTLPRLTLGGAVELGDRVEGVLRELARLYPGTVRSLCALHFDSPFELLVATVLSAQTTDATVNAVTANLFQAFPTVAALGDASVKEVERVIHPSGFYHTKARHVVRLCQIIRDTYAGVVPSDMDALTSLPGVGRKTANVVRSIAFDLPGLAVDTHVMRVSQRIGVTQQKTPEAIERELCDVVAPQEWGLMGLRLIQHGRQVCRARVPACFRCTMTDCCLSAPSEARSPG